MKKPRESKTGKGDAPGHDFIAGYAEARPLEIRKICDRLRELIDSALPKATSQVWHGSPVWFIDENPVVGYKASAKTATLLFWNGQAFDEPALNAVGKYRAAQAVFGESAEIDPKAIRRWLKKSRSDVFDSKTFFQKLRKAK